MTHAIGRRRKRDRGYVQIENAMFQDKQLSFKAKGILGYLLTKPDGWTVRVLDLQNHAKDGRDSVESGLKELRRNGYLRFFRTKKPDGKWGTPIWEYDDLPFFKYKDEKPEILNVPFDEPENEEIPIDGPQTGIPFMDETLDTTDPNHKRETRVTENRDTEKPSTEKPCYISNKDLSNKDLNNKKTTKTTKELKELVISSSSPEINKIDLIFKSLYKDAPLEEIKKKLFEDAENRKVKMKTEEQYLALFAKRIQFYLDAQENTPKTPETGQISDDTTEIGEIPIEERSRQFKAFLSESEGVDDSEADSEPNSPLSEADSEPNSEVATESEPNSEMLETYLNPADRQKKITESLAITQDPEKTPEEIEQAKKEIKRLMDQIRDEKR